MAHLPRVGKPIQEWNQQDLLAYNIHVHPQHQSVFFNGLRCSGGVLPSLPPNSPLHPFLTTQTINWNAVPPISRPTSTLLSLLYSPIRFSSELDGKVDNFVAYLIASMGPPYVSVESMIGPVPSLTFENCGKTYETYADLCAHSDCLVSDMVHLLITLERFVGLNIPSQDDDVDPKSNFDLQYWIKKPVKSWPRDDAEAKLIAAAIATYNFNNYEVPKRYHELDADDKQKVDPLFVVHDPSFLAGMTWEGTRPSFYKLSIGSELVNAVRVGTYPRVPTMVYK
jgi:hypothetical protein